MTLPRRPGAINLMPDTTARLAALESRVREACLRAGRAPGACRLLAVSKTRDIDEIRMVAAAGATDFGENYVQEALPKIAGLADLHLTWHLIGPLQSNKTWEVAAHFAWVHSIDRERIARRLNDQRPPGLPPLNVCLQVNIDDEESKAGVSLAALPALARAVATMPRLRLRGLMVIPRPDQPAGPANAYARLAQTLQALAGTIPDRADPDRDGQNPGGERFDTLSMGMSDDFELAIAHGATWVRIGTALFGPRPAKTT